MWWDEDIIAAAREGLALAGATYNDNKGMSFRSWIYLKVQDCIIQECRDRFGRNGEKISLTISIDEAFKEFNGIESMTIEKDLHEKFVFDLKKKHRDRYNKYKFYGMTMREIAASEDVTESAVSYSLKKTFKKLNRFKKKIGEL
jgi:RNA polymerase sigma factor (sigma-70 family)